MGGFALASRVLLFGWIGVKSVAAAIVWAVLIALFMGPLAVLYQIIVPHLSPEKDLVGTRTGTSSAAAALGTLVGFPVTSALNDIETEVFWKSQCLNGCYMFCGAVLMIYVYYKCSELDLCGTPIFGHGLSYSPKDWRRWLR